MAELFSSTMPLVVVHTSQQEINPIPFLNPVFTKALSNVAQVTFS